MVLILFIPSLLIYFFLYRYFTKDPEGCNTMLLEFDQLPAWKKTAWEFAAAILMVAPFIWMLVLAFYHPVN